MQSHTQQITTARDTVNMTWEAISSDLPSMHFYHANGFTAGVYEPLLKCLSQHFDVKALNNRACWPDTGSPPRKGNWSLYADDLIAFIESQYDQPIIGAGHSLGATCTAIAAQKRPDLFKCLVLIEPAMVTRSVSIITALTPKPLFKKNPLINGTLRKRDQWESREDYRSHSKKFSGYREFTETAFSALAEHNVKNTDNGKVTLSFDKHWEAHNYMNPTYGMKYLSKIKIPCVAIRAKPSVFFTESMWQRWQSLAPSTVFFEELSYGHLLPIANAEKASQLMISGYQALNF